MDVQNWTPLHLPDLNGEKKPPVVPPAIPAVEKKPEAAPVSEPKVQAPAAPPVGGYHMADLTVQDSGHSHKINILLIVAVLILLICGAVAAYFYMQQPKPPSGALKPTPMAQISPKPFFLKVASPKGEVDIINGEVLVTGTTFPNTALAVYTDIDDEAVESDAQGNFETSVLIDKEGGLLRITAYAEDGTEKTETLQVFSSESVLGKSDAPGQQKKDESGSSGGGNTNNNAGGNSNNNSGGNSNNNAGGNSNNNSGGNSNNNPGGNTDTGNPGQQNLVEKRTLTTTQTTAEEKVKTQELKKNQTDPVEFKKVKTAEVREEKKLGAEKIRELIAEAKKGESAGSNSAGLEIKKVEAKAAPGDAVMKRHAVSGVVVSFGEGTITIVHRIQQDRTNVILYNANTIFQTKSDKTGTDAVLQPGARISAVGVPSDEGLLATRIHVIPGALKTDILEPVLRTLTPTVSVAPTLTVTPPTRTFLTGPSPTPPVIPTVEPTVALPTATPIPPSPTKAPPTPTTYRAPL